MRWLPFARSVHISNRLSTVRSRFNISRHRSSLGTRRDPLVSLLQSKHWKRDQIGERLGRGFRAGYLRNKSVPARLLPHAPILVFSGMPNAFGMAPLDRETYLSQKHF